MYKNNSRDTCKFKGCSSLQLFCILTGKCHAVGYYSYTKRCGSFTAEMKNFINRILSKIGLVTSMNLELDLTPEAIVEKLSKKVDNDRPDLFDDFTFNKREYKGTISTNQFDLKKCKIFIVSFEHFARAKGKFNSNNGRLSIDAEIFASQRYSVFIGFTLTALLFTSISLIGFTSFLITHELDGLLVGITLLVFETVFLGLPTLAMRWSVANLKSDLVNELTNIREK